MIVDPWKSRVNLVQILREPFLDLFGSSFDFFKLYVAFSGVTAWHVYYKMEFGTTRLWPCERPSLICSFRNESRGFSAAFSNLFECSWWNVCLERPIFTMTLNLLFAKPIGSTTLKHSTLKISGFFVLYSSEMRSSQESQLLSASPCVPPEHEGQDVRVQPWIVSLPCQVSWPQFLGNKLLQLVPCLVEALHSRQFGKLSKLHGTSKKCHTPAQPPFFASHPSYAGSGMRPWATSESRGRLGTGYFFLVSWKVL